MVRDRERERERGKEAEIEKRRERERERKERVTFNRQLRSLKPERDVAEASNQSHESSNFSHSSFLAT